VKRIMVIVVVLVVGIALGAALYAYVPEFLRPGSAEPPANFVVVTERVHTSGQPSAAQLSGLKGKGYGLVINLAPPTTLGSISDEGMLVARTGISYLNIPVDWYSPRYEDFELFSNILKQSGSMHVLVHCQVNKRASVFTFLFRVVHDDAAPDRAWENVNAVWVPDEHWKDFARLVLKRHKIDYDPF